MQQLSISDIQRNLHKLDNFDIVEIIDKKRDKVKGYFIDSKYLSVVQELMTYATQQKEKSGKIAGSLSDYANPSLIEDESRAWGEYIEEKYKK
jgi:hypothetical protein